MPNYPDTLTQESMLSAGIKFGRARLQQARDDGDDDYARRLQDDIRVKEHLLANLRLGVDLDECVQSHEGRLIASDALLDQGRTAEATLLRAQEITCRVHDGNVVAVFPSMTPGGNIEREPPKRVECGLTLVLACMMQLMVSDRECKWFAFYRPESANA